MVAVAVYVLTTDVLWTLVPLLMTVAVVRHLALRDTASSSPTDPAEQAAKAGPGREHPDLTTLQAVDPGPPAGRTRAWRRREAAAARTVSADAARRMRDLRL